MTSSRSTASVPVRFLRMGIAVTGRLFPALVGRWAYGQVFRPRRRRSFDRHKKILEHATSDRDLKIHGKAISSYAWGTHASTVLLVHGWESTAARFESLVSALVEAGLRVVAFDAPAHGASEGAETDILEFTQAMLELQRRYGPFSAALGHSFGGMCLAHALQSGLSSSKVVLMSTPAHFTGLKEKLSVLLAAPPAVVANVGARVERRFAPMTSDPWNCFSALQNAGKQTAPALIVHDELDSEVPFKEAEELAAAWPRAHLIHTRGLGHRRVLDSPDVIQQVLRFLNPDSKSQSEPAAAASDGP